MVVMPADAYISSESLTRQAGLLLHVVGFPDGLRVGYEGWTRFRVLVPGGQAAARVDLGYGYHLPPGSFDRPITLHRPGFFQLASTEEYFATIQDACRS